MFGSLGMGTKLKHYLKKILENKSLRLLVITVLFFIFVKYYFVWGILSFVSNDNRLLVYAILVYIFCSLLALLVILFISMMQKYMYKNLYKNKNDYNERLYIWLGEDEVSNKFINGLFGGKASKSYDDIVNLRKIKTVLDKRFKNSILDYKLLKNHLEFKTKKNFDSRAGTVLMTIIGTILTTQLIPMLGKYFFKEENTDALLKQFTSLFGSEGIYSLFLYGAIFILIYLPVKSILLFATVNKRRLEYIISILDIIIKEKEKSSSNP